VVIGVTEAIEAESKRERDGRERIEIVERPRMVKDEHAKAQRQREGGLSYLIPVWW
jgi:hypothetical protein